MSKMDRRDFLKKAALGTAAAVAGAGLLTGCNSSTTTGAPKDSDSITWDKETDVLVVGSGCGLAAAIEAKTQGAGDVLIIEKADHIGGLFIAAGGHTITGCTYVHKEMGIEDKPEWWYEDEMRASEYRAVPEIVRAYVNRGPDDILWLHNLGLEFEIRPKAHISYGHRVGRSLWVASSPNYPGAFGHAWITVLKREVDRLGIPILLQHRLVRLHRPDRYGPVIGAEVETPQGTINIKARKAIILCTGGTTDNTRMAMAQDPRLGPESDIMGDAGGAPGSGGPYVENTGDGHLATVEIGGDLTGMAWGTFLAFRFGSKPYFVWEPRDWENPPANRGTGLSLPVAKLPYVIWVKGDGKRYVNEAFGGLSIERTVSGFGGGNIQAPGEWKEGLDRYELTPMEGILGGLPHEYPEHPFMRAFLNIPDRPRNVWVITDADGREALGWDDNTMRNPNPLVSPALYPDSVAVADTIAELASKMGMPADALEATINRYNGFVDAGYDEDFGRTLPMYKIQKPPFYAAKANLLRHTQGNGIRINSKAQVIERMDQWDGHHAVSSIDEEKVIPHLYAAGECTGFLGWRRNHGKLGACITFARIAGENAAKESPVE